MYAEVLAEGVPPTIVTSTVCKLLVDPTAILMEYRAGVSVVWLPNEQNVSRSAEGKP